MTTDAGESGGPTRRIGRRGLLRGAAALGAGAPVLWREALGEPAAAATTQAIGPRWLAFGPTPTSQMSVNWSCGSAGAAVQKPISPQVRWGLTASYGSTQRADSSGTVPLPAPAAGEPAENTTYNTALLGGLSAGTTYHYSVTNDGVTWSPDAKFTTAAGGLSSYRFTAFGDQAASATRAAPMMSLM